MKRVGAYSSVDMHCVTPHMPFALLSGQPCDGDLPTALIFSYVSHGVQKSGGVLVIAPLHTSTVISLIPNTLISQIRELKLILIGLFSTK
jgi:hypothetical protein